MKVSIWDLDYYYSKKKVNCFNADVMRISSYHKQLGDQVNFVTSQYDIYRPYDLYYIIRENDKTPGPPSEFFLNPKVKWWGKAYKMRINWKMNDAMMGCRPDYLLYPEKNTAMERAEHIRFFNNEAKLLPLQQNWANTFKNKFVIIDDDYMWCADEKDIITALDRLQDIKKVSFSEPIWLQKLLSNKELKDKFLNLKFSPGSVVSWFPVGVNNIEDAFVFIEEFKIKFSQVSSGVIKFDYRRAGKSHWDSKENALTDFEMVKKVCVAAKERNIRVEVMMPEYRLETPYFFMFEEIANWSQKHWKYSWLEYITMQHGRVARDISDYHAMTIYWSHPERWTEVFRDLLRQTYTDRKFLLTKDKNNSINENDITIKIWESEFKYGI